MKLTYILFALFIGFLLLLTRRDLKHIDAAELNFYSGSNKLIVSHGRVKRLDRKLECYAPGTYFEFDYIGDKCTIFLSDQIRFGNHNYIEVVFDNERPKRIKLEDANHILHLGKSKSFKRHHVLICKNTESSIGYLQLNGVRCNKLVKLSKTTNREIEIIGNSITCGNGSDLSKIGCNEGDWYDQHNAYMSYGALIARRFNANWTLTGVSGIGLTRSCCGMKFTMPMVYKKFALNPKSEDWEFKGPKPSIVCVTLGQNDGIQKKELFVSTYVNFIHDLKQIHPKAQLILCTSPMANDKLRNHLQECILEVEKRVNAKEYSTKITHFFYSKCYNGGCKGHPTIEQHEEIAKELGDFIEKNNLWNK